MSHTTLTVEIAAPVAVITIAREKALNALNRTVMTELHVALSTLEADPQVRAIVLTGAGEKAFVAGADIGEMAGFGPQEARAFAEAGHQIGDLIARMGKPVIAAVNGFALGGGCELALACDFVYASDRAKF